MSILEAVDDIISKPLPQALKHGGLKMARTAVTELEIPRTGDTLWDKAKRTMAEANGAASKNMGIVVICLCALIPGSVALIGGGIAWGSQSEKTAQAELKVAKQDDRIKELENELKEQKQKMDDKFLHQTELIMALNGQVEAFKRNGK